MSACRIPVLLVTIGLFGLPSHASSIYEERQLFFLKDMLVQDIKNRVENKKTNLRYKAYVKSFGGIIKSDRTYPAKYSEYNPLITEGGWRGHTRGDLRTHLEPIFVELWTVFGHKAINEHVLIRWCVDNPSIWIEELEDEKWAKICLFVNGPRYREYTYQFAHELVHLFANVEEDSRVAKLGWLDEMFADLGSAYVLRKFYINSPYPSYSRSDWDEYYNAAYDGKDQDLVRNYNIQISTDPPDWLPNWIDDLERYRYERALNWAFARELLPYFIAMPELWQQVGMLHRWKTRPDSLQELLRVWEGVLKENGMKTTVVDLMRERIPLKIRLRR